MNDFPWLVMDSKFAIVARGTEDQCLAQIAAFRRSGKTDTFCVYAPFSCHTTQVVDNAEFYRIPDRTGA